MNRFVRALAGLTAAALIVLMAVLLGQPAGAATTPTPATDCKTVVTHLANRPDHGHGTPDVWALDTMTRTVEVCAQQPAQNAAVAIETWTYTATLTDVGTFLTQAGPTGSPNDGKPLVGGVAGALQGKAIFNKFTAPHDWIAWDPSAVDGKNFNGTEPGSTGDWLKLLWKDGLKQSGIDSYAWIYQTCVGKIVRKGYVEQWVDSSSNHDGQDASAGDITGKRCPTGSPSPSATTPSALPSLPLPTTPGVSLPVTGSNVPLLIGGGVTLVTAGAVLLVLTLRRRRNRVEFTA